MQDVASYIGGTMSLTLPVVHALSGCDSTSSLLGIRKNHWLNRGSYMSAHVLLNLSNQLGKRDKMRGLPSI